MTAIKLDQSGNIIITCLDIFICVPKCCIHVPTISHVKSIF